MYNRSDLFPLLPVCCYKNHCVRDLKERIGTTIVEIFNRDKRCVNRGYNAWNTYKKKEKINYSLFISRRVPRVVTYGACTTRALFFIFLTKICMRVLSAATRVAFEMRRLNPWNGQRWDRLLSRYRDFSNLSRAKYNEFGAPYFNTSMWKLLAVYFTPI